MLFIHICEHGHVAFKFIYLCPNSLVIEVAQWN